MSRPNQPFPRLFLSLSIAFVISSTIILLTSEKGVTVLALNDLHNGPLDIFFKYYTFLGSGWILLLATVLTALWSYRLSITVVIISAFQGLASLLFKTVFFPNIKRPIAYFEDIDLNLVEGVPALYLRSFPSGHTITAFGIATFFSIVSAKKRHHLALFIFAFLVAISRIYLSLHFLSDTVAGAILGITITLVVLLLIRKVKFFENPNFDRGLLG